MVTSTKTFFLFGFIDLYNLRNIIAFWFTEADEYFTLQNIQTICIDKMPAGISELEMRQLCETAGPVLVRLYSSLVFLISIVKYIFFYSFVCFYAENKKKSYF